MIIRWFKYIIGTTFLLIGFIIIDKQDLLDLVNSVKERLSENDN